MIEDIIVIGPVENGFIVEPDPDGKNSKNKQKIFVFQTYESMFVHIRQLYGPLVNNVPDGGVE